MLNSIEIYDGKTILNTAKYNFLSSAGKLELHNHFEVAWITPKKVKNDEGDWVREKESMLEHRYNPLCVGWVIRLTAQSHSFMIPFFLPLLL